MNSERTYCFMWSKENSGWFMVSWEVWMLWFESSKELSILSFSIRIFCKESNLRKGRLVSGFTETGVIGTGISTLSLDGRNVDWRVSG
jgi:hypothetical protein